MKASITFLACFVLPAAAWTAADKTAALDWVADQGMPKLGAFAMDEVTPSLLKTFVKINGVLSADDAFEYIGNVEREVIFTVTSAANNCEICLSFHTASLMKQKALSREDIDRMATGGIPNNPKYQNLAIAAKYAAAHKGIFLEREKLHLKQLGFSLDAMYEITFLVGQMTANNYVFASLINEGAPVEDFLKELGPFAGSVYKEELAKKEL